MKKDINKNTFINSVKYYDLIYQNKNYYKEVETIKKIVNKNLNRKQIELLDLGCGTGEHCFLFAKLGYQVTGIDKSIAAISMAKKKQLNSKNKINFIEDDICKFNLNKKFDVITCLFHVTSYLVSQQSLNNFFLMIENHLKDDGLFIFDCWYGPGVLLDKPSTSYKKYKNEKITVHRIKEPIIFEDKKLVKIKHNFFIEKNSSNSIFDHFYEEHTLRYFFFEEIKKYLKKHNLNIIRWGKLENNFRPTLDNDYETCFIVKKQIAC